MSYTTAFSLEELNTALLKDNPFNEVSTRYDNIWNKGFIDVEFLNAHASDAVFNALNQNRTTSIVITADYGRGKSHIIGRIRYRLKSQGGALFVYVNKYPDLSQLHNSFQYMLAESLTQTGNKRVTQWQDLATILFNQCLSLNQNKTYYYSPQEVIHKFSEAEKTEQGFNKLRKGIEKLSQTLLTKTQVIGDPDIIKAILWTLSPQQNFYAVKWLSGQEISEKIAKQLNLPTQAQSFEIVRQILDIISQYSALVICFDELDSEDIDYHTGLTRAQVVAGLIKELFENLKQGVILSVMRPDVWKDKIKNVSGLAYGKISDYREPFDLYKVDEATVLVLVKVRLQDFYNRHLELVPHPNIYYPFSEDELRQQGKSKSSTTQNFLKWCRDELQKRLSSEPLSVKDPIQEAFELEMTEKIDLDDNITIAKALFLGFSYLIGQTVEKVKILELMDKVEKQKKYRIYINFKIIGQENGKDVSIGVAVLQQEGAVSLAAGLRRLNQYSKYNLTRGCLVRSIDKKISASSINRYLNPLIQEKGGEFVALKENEVRPLLALAAIIDKQGVDYQFTDEQIQEFIANRGREYLLGQYNPLLREILSDPSRKIPDNLTEDDNDPVNYRSSDEEKDTFDFL